jgi:hypothetical protein
MEQLVPDVPQRIPGSIFSQPWWLDIVAPDSWGEVVVEKGGELYARMPYVIRRKLGLTILDMPTLTQTLGPWLRPYEGKYTGRLSEEKALMTELIHKLPKHDIFLQNFHYSISNWLPFYWAGFEQTTRYTYVIKDLSDTNAIWKGLRENIRSDIRKAKKTLAVRNDLGVEKFISLNEMVFKRQNKKRPYSPNLVERISDVCAERQCYKIFFAEDVKGNVHAAVYVIWDDQSAYYLMGGSDPELRNSGATSLCMWKAIEFASFVTRKFDFEGSMIEPVERFFRAFGALQTPYFKVSKVNSKILKIVKDIRSWI